MYNEQNLVDSEALDFLMEGGDSFGYPDYDADNFKLPKIKLNKKLLKKINPIAGIATIALGGALSKKITRKPLLGVAGAAKDLVKMAKKANNTDDVTQAYNRVLNASNTVVNESSATDPGQIGTEAGAITVPSYSANQQSLAGGGAGDIGGDYSVDIESTGGETSTATDPKELPGVTVTSGKPNWLLLGIIAALAVVAVIYITKYSSKKK